ncbi:MAG: HupE/UreJ family protein [Bacteroidia bacterium]|nr:HupE/UreJ family protein [Bacteroidia bacterium]
MDCFGGFDIYFPIGREHILDIQGYDHILFVIALTIMYQLKEWRKVLLMVTAFTIGHSITLAMSVFEIILIPSPIVEFLIPITILLTAVFNIYQAWKNKAKGTSMLMGFGIAMAFGFIHGMGFSNFLKAMLGQEMCITGPLLYFNLGLEFGQIIIVVIVLALTFLATGLLPLKHRYWKMGVSILVGVVSIYLISQTWEGLSEYLFTTKNL